MPEAAALLDAPHARTEQEMLEQGRSLLAMGCGAVLMKGGHLDDEQSPDWLFTREGEQRFTAPRIMTKTPTALVVHSLRRWLHYARAIQTGLTPYRRQKLAFIGVSRADTLEVGHGIGPVHHFHARW